jgi:hypothetical protein
VAAPPKFLGEIFTPLHSFWENRNIVPAVTLHILFLFYEAKL